MLEVWTECIMDIVKTIPILFVVYLVISWMENHMDAVTRVVTSTEPAGPVIGALIGAIPQCGFSMGCSVLYCRGFLAPATLIAVYLSTSDEAIPVLFAGGCSWKEIVLLIAVKIGIAIVAGYLFYLFWFRKHWNIDDWPLLLLRRPIAVALGAHSHGKYHSFSRHHDVDSQHDYLSARCRFAGGDFAARLSPAAGAVCADRIDSGLCRVGAARAAVYRRYHQLWQCDCRTFRRCGLWFYFAAARSAEQTIRLADYRLHVCGSRCGGTADRLYYINDCLSNDIPPIY